MSTLRKVLSITFRKNIKLTIKRNINPRFLSTDSTNILNSDLKDVTIPKISIPEYIFENCEKYSKYPAIECGLTGRKYTYGQLIEKSKNLSRSLRAKLALKDGDVIAILLPNIPEFALTILGALHANLIITTLNPIYTKEEITRQLVDSSAKAIVTFVNSYELAFASSQLLTKSIPVIAIKTEQSQSLPSGAIDFYELINNRIDCVDPEPRKPEDVAFLPYSSGTTGLPKGVQLTNYNIISNISQNSSPELPWVIETSDTYQDVVPVILPMFHIYGFTINTLQSLYRGTKLVTLPKFTPEDYVSLIRKHKPTILFLVPPIVMFLTNHPMVKKEDLQSIRLTFSGAAPLGALDEQKFVDKVGKKVDIMQGYGLTEASPCVSVIPLELKERVNTDGSVGVPLPNTSLKVINPDDPTGKPLGPNTIGELLIKGPQVMKSYLNRPEETKNTFLDGWLRTGDMVYYNEHKILYVTDRLKELIKVKGFQVAPAELEEIIRDFPNVEDAAVIGIPHPSRGEAPRAYIVPKKNTKINTKDLEDFVKSKVASYKELKGGVVLVDSIPKNASGKLLRRQLKMEFEKLNEKK